MAGVVLGGFIGFWSGLIGVLAFDWPVLAGVLTWGLSGPASVLVVVAVALLRRPVDCEDCSG